MGSVVELPARRITPADEERFARYLAFYKDGASMSEAQWREHLKERAFARWLRARGYTP